MPKNGILSASYFNKCMTKGKRTESVMKVCYQKAMERAGWDAEMLEEIYGLEGIRQIDWGNEMEPIAIERYEAETMTTVHGRQVWEQRKTPSGTIIGCTTDGLVGTDGMIEVKCPDPINHVKNIIEGAQVSNYINQLQESLWVHDRQWCDFVSFDPRALEVKQYFKVRILADEAIQSAIIERADFMETEIKRIVEVLSK